MIIYLLLFCILLSSVTQDIGIFSRALPSIIIRNTCYIIIAIIYRRELLQLFKEEKIIKYFSLLSALLIIWGIVISKDIYDYTVCIEYIFLPLLPIWIILMGLPNNYKLLKFIFWCMLILSFSKYSTESQSMNNFGGYTSLLYIFVLFLPNINIFKKIILLFLWFISLTFDITDRTHWLMMIGSMLLAIISYSNLSLKFSKLNNIIRKLLFIAPFVMVISIFTSLNIFNLSESKEFEDMQGDEIENVDTRTGLYEEVLTDQGGEFSWIFGKSFIGKYNSSLAESYGLIKLNRIGCEVGILEMFIRGGLIYVFIIAVLFFKISKKGITESSNKFTKIMSFFILLYWIVFFIELQMSSGNWTIALWMAFGLILNNEIRAMDDDKIKIWSKKCI